jgi:hypothetical protein
MYRKIRPVLVALVFVGSLVSPALFAQSKPSVASSPIEPRALDLLEAARTKLDNAKAFSFRTRTAQGSQGGSPEVAVFFADSQFAVLRPDKSRAKVRGGPAMDLYFDGAKLTAYQPTLNVYSTATLEALIPFALQRPEILFLLGDVLQSDPKTITQSITRARYKGATQIAGNRCDHAAFAAPGLEWELWIDTRTALPCRLTGTLLDVQGTPRFAMDFFDWKLNPAVSAASFAFSKPTAAVELDMRALIGQ